MSGLKFLLFDPAAGHTDKRQVIMLCERVKDPRLSRWRHKNIISFVTLFYCGPVTESVIWKKKSDCTRNLYDARDSWIKFVLKFMANA